MTPMAPITEDIIKEQMRILRDELMKWTMFGAQWKLNTLDFYGKPIRQEGILFSGTFRRYFWCNHFDPFIENAIKVSLASLVAVCKEKNLEPEEYVREMEFILKNRVEVFVHEMEITDIRLLNMGRIKGEQPWDTKPKLSHLLHYLSRQVDAAIFLGKPAKKDEEKEPIQIKPSYFGISIDLKELLQRWFKRTPKNAPNQKVTKNTTLLEKGNWVAGILVGLIMLYGVFKGAGEISKRAEVQGSGPAVVGDLKGENGNAAVGNGNTLIKADKIGSINIDPQSSEAEKLINHEIRNQIGKLLERGQNIIAEFVPNADPLKMRKKEKIWEKQVENLFKKYPGKFDATDLANFHVKGTEDHVAPQGIGGDLYFGWADTSSSVEALRKISDRFR